ncbi:hypothetical protein PVK06_002651 [Gossypium arboreum]|uniref:Uncharacterized protein n=1 Tax=Gossypium arboreum TaxID=29729 RepID=A0ABR0R597_GOSAR|nr:hypothetical protein PVK06_002651 [Gossypium arboreum]
MACDSPKQAWEKLKEEFIGSDKTRQQQLINLRRDFENLKMRESETIKQYSDRIMAIVNNIRPLGDNFSESRVVEKVITTFPEKFELKISSLDDSRDLSTISLSELVNSLYALEQMRATGKKSILKELSKQRPIKAQVLVKRGRNLGSIEGRNQGEMQGRRGFYHAFTAKRLHIWRRTAGTDQMFSAGVANSWDMLRGCEKTKGRHKLSSKCKLRLLRIFKLRRSMFLQPPVL